jgi:ribonuclease BN (tRNA processing enzyme)
VPWERLGATIEFVQLDEERWYEIGGIRVKLKKQPHPGDSYGYRFEQNGKAAVYSTDAEHKLRSESDTEEMVEFFRNADLVIFDAMYSLNDMINSKADWGHSSNVVGVDLCVRAEVKHYCMFHHDPAHSDDRIHRILGETRRYAEIAAEGRKLEVSAAYDGLVVAV